MKRINLAVVVIGLCAISSIAFAKKSIWDMSDKELKPKCEYYAQMKSTSQAEFEQHFDYCMAYPVEALKENS